MDGTRGLHLPLRPPHVSAFYEVPDTNDGHGHVLISWHKPNRGILCAPGEAKKRISERLG